MGRYTSDHKVTTRDGSGRIVSEYVAKDQIDVAKVGGAAAGPIIIVGIICLLLLLAFPLLAYVLLLWNMNQARKQLQDAGQDHATLHRSITIKFYVWLILGGLYAALSSYMIVTADIAQYLYLTGGDYYGFTADNNFFNQIIDVYQQIWPFILSIPLIAGALFAGNEYEASRIVGEKRTIWQTIVRAPYLAMYWLLLFPFSKLLFAGIKRTAIALVVAAALFLGHNFYMDAQFQQYDNAEYFVSELYERSEWKKPEEYLAQLMEEEQVNLSDSYGSVFYLYWPGLQLNRLVDSISGGTRHQRDFMNSVYAGRNILTLMLEQVNRGRQSSESFLKAAKVYQKLGGELDITDEVGLPAWAYVQNQEALKAVQKLQITLGPETEALVQDNLIEYGNF